MARTHTNPFTTEQMDYLRVNHYVKNISSSTIRFTEEFKKYFYEKYHSGFTDKRSSNYRRPPKNDKITVETRLKQLEHELAYTRQEVEFLKNCKWQIWRRAGNGNPDTGRSEIRPHI